MNNKKIITLTIVVLLFSFGGYITYHVIKQYRNNVLLVTEKRIIEAAKKCVDEDKCPAYPVKLEDLYNFGYLSEEANPLTKEVYAKSSYIDLIDNKLVFNPLY